MSINENPKCPECGGSTVRKGQTDSGTGYRYKCKECAHPFSIKTTSENFNVKADDREYKIKDTGNILVFSCAHLPFERRGYLDFLVDVKNRFNCKTVINLGDFVDSHAISMHDHSPDGMSGAHEIDLVREKISDWVEAFPNMLITKGNHDVLPYRQAYALGLPKCLIKDLNAIYGTPDTWKWVDRVYDTDDDIVFQHGSGKSGENASKMWAVDNRKSTCIGHIHTVLTSGFMTNHYDRIFHMCVGSGLDESSYAAEYGKFFGKRPVSGCGVILKSPGSATVPLTIPMNL